MRMLLELPLLLALLLLELQLWLELLLLLLLLLRLPNWELIALHTCAQLELPTEPCDQMVLPLKMMPPKT